MMKVPFEFARVRALAAVLALVPVAASGSERAGLLGCFESIQALSKGPGDDIGRYEQHDPRKPSSEFRIRPTILVPGMRAGREGLYVYADGSTYFVPRIEGGDGSLFGFHFDLDLPNRDPFRCVLKEEAQSWEDLSRKIYRKGTRCWRFNSHAERAHYHRARFVELRPQDDPDAALRTAVSLRISSMAELYRREVARYRERLEEFVSARNNTGGGVSLKGILGLAPGRPSAPDRDRYLRALGACRGIENEFVRSGARAVHSLIENHPVPTEAQVAVACGR